jgi:hypothetical protein
MKARGNMIERGNLKARADSMIQRFKRESSLFLRRHSF